jgi:uncharacterized protein (UPF0333 family)
MSKRNIKIKNKFKKEDFKMKRLGLFIVALVFVFSTTVMAESNAEKREAATVKAENAEMKADAKVEKAEKKAAKKRLKAAKKAEKKRLKAEKEAADKVEDAK